jgi:hypothetical protein
MSRHGIKVTEQEVSETIMLGLGGSDYGDEPIDMVELVAILMIPTLLKSSRENDEAGLPEKLVKPPPGLINRVLTMILEDVTGDSTPKKLDEDLLRRIFEAYGEYDLAEDVELHKKMLSDLQTSEKGEVMLDLSTFVSALTRDVQLYDILSELRCTTHVSDVLVVNENNVNEVLDAKDTESPAVESPSDLEKVFTAPAIDSTAGTTRSKHLVIFLWTSGEF